MKVLIFKSEAEAKRQAALRILNQVKRVPQSVLGLATGGTMEAVYAHIIEVSREQNTSWSDVVTFNLDEYWGIPEDSPASYRSYMNTHLFEHINIKRASTHIPQSNGTDPKEAAQNYEQAIALAGGIDLQLLGIGQNGHIGFNEPTSSLASSTRIKTLTKDTREANLRFFDRLEDVPSYALTMGIGTILHSKECLILGTGLNKSAAVKAMIEGPVCAICPASALQMHRDVTVIIDQEAAQDLELRDYYHHVHPQGQECDLIRM